MWNPEAFRDIYNVTFQKNTISYTAVKTPMLARSINVYVVHVDGNLDTHILVNFSCRGAGPLSP